MIDSVDIAKHSRTAQVVDRVATLMVEDDAVDKKVMADVINVVVEYAAKMDHLAPVPGLQFTMQPYKLSNLKNRLDKIDLSEELQTGVQSIFEEEYKVQELNQAAIEGHRRGR